MKKDDVREALTFIALGTLALAMIPVVFAFGSWVFDLPALCDEKMGNAGSQGGSALTCDSASQSLTIEPFGKSVVAVCRCPK